MFEIYTIIAYAYAPMDTFCLEIVQNISMLNVFGFKKAGFSKIREFLESLLLKSKEIANCLI